MLQRTEGMVLRTVPYGEADLIVTYLTRDFGILKVFAKSPRKTKSRFGSSLEPLTCARISFWGREDAALPRLTQADIVRSFEPLRSSLNRLLRVLEIVEMTLHLLPERDGGSCVYPLLVETLGLFEEQEEAGLLLLAYKIRLLDAAGFLPGLERCGRCGRDGRHFHAAQGTVFCPACTGENTSTRILPATAGLFRALLGWELRKLNRLKPSDEAAAALRDIVDAHVRHVTERALRSRDFVN